MKEKRRRSASGDSSVPKRVALVGEAPDWQPELEALLLLEGFATDRVGELEMVLSLLARGAVSALFLAAGPRAASDLLLLQRIRQVSPLTAVVVVTKTPTDPDLKRAFENGATAFLSWPASNDALRRAMDRRAPQSSTSAPVGQPSLAVPEGRKK